MSSLNQRPGIWFCPVDQRVSSLSSIANGGRPFMSQQDAVTTQPARLSLVPLGLIGTQTPLLHSPLLQSPPFAQFLPFAQPVQPAPQSISDSVPFMTPSEQL